MPGRPPVTYPSEQRRLRALGERLRLARLRRRFSVALVAERAGISRTTLYHVERGDTAVTFGTVVRVLSVLGGKLKIKWVCCTLFGTNGTLFGPFRGSWPLG